MEPFRRTQIYWCALCGKEWQMPAAIPTKRHWRYGTGGKYAGEVCYGKLILLTYELIDGWQGQL